jgi:hypothetical protein
MRGLELSVRQVQTYRLTSVCAPRQMQSHTATVLTEGLTRSWMVVMEDQTEDACYELHRTSSRDFALENDQPVNSRKRLEGA